MRVLITGGSGLIGKALTADLLAAGHEVVVLTRDPGKTQVASGAQAVQWDARTPAGWSSLFDRESAIIHLAGESIAGGRWTRAKKQRIRASRVDSGRALVDAIRGATVKPGVLLQASGVGYYGPCGDEVITEHAGAGGDWVASVCKDWEASTAGVESFGVRRAILRTGLVLARQGGALPRLALPFRLLAGGPLGTGRQWMPWIHLADEVGAIRFLLTREDAAGPFNLTAPRPLTNRDFSRALGKALRRPSLLPAPGFALRLALGEMADMVLTGQRAVPHRLLELGYAFQFTEAGTALSDLLR